MTVTELHYGDNSITVNYGDSYRIKLVRDFKVGKLWLEVCG